MMCRLRQCVDHPLLVLGKGANEEQEGEKLLDAESGDAQGSLKEMIAMYAGGIDKSSGDTANDTAYALKVLKDIGESEETSECFICASEIFDEVLLPCYHRGRVRPYNIQSVGLTLCRCQDCIVNFLGTCEDRGKPANCPICAQGPYRATDLRSVQRHRKRLNPITGAYTGSNGSADNAVYLGKVDLVSSTKLRALVRKLEVMRLEDKDFKALVFSQFTSFLGELPRYGPSASS